jgi:hypothetical protein
MGGGVRGSAGRRGVEGPLAFSVRQARRQKKFVAGMGSLLEFRYWQAVNGFGLGGIAVEAERATARSGIGWP